MTTEQRAMLGDKEAQRQITERGELLPCSVCKKAPKKSDIFPTWRGFTIFHECKVLGATRVKGKSLFDAVTRWNDRPEILTVEQIDALETMEPNICGKCKHLDDSGKHPVCWHTGLRIRSKKDFCSYFEPFGGNHDA